MTKTHNATVGSRATAVLWVQHTERLDQEPSTPHSANHCTTLLHYGVNFEGWGIHDFLEKGGPAGHFFSFSYTVCSFRFTVWTGTKNILILLCRGARSRFLQTGFLNWTRTVLTAGCLVLFWSLLFTNSYGEMCNQNDASATAEIPSYISYGRLAHLEITLINIGLTWYAGEVVFRCSILDHCFN